MKLTREPAAIVAAVQAALVMAVGFGWLDAIGLETQQDVAVVVVVLTAASGVYLAWRLQQILLNPIVELFKAILALGAIYGFQISTEQTAMAISFIFALGALVQRQANDPDVAPSFKTNVRANVTLAA